MTFKHVDEMSMDSQLAYACQFVLESHAHPYKDSPIKYIVKPSLSMSITIKRTLTFLEIYDET